MSLEKVFHLKENHTDVKTEVLAGVTTFMTMAYILAVNPLMLSAAGMDASAVLIATALASFVGTVCMALFANYPFALAPGMGLNAYFAYTVCLGRWHISWESGPDRLYLRRVSYFHHSCPLTNVREADFRCHPHDTSNMRCQLSGIGLLHRLHRSCRMPRSLSIPHSTLLTYQNFKGGTFHSIGITALLAIIGVIITGYLLIKNVKGGILFGILITWVLGMICQAIGLYVPDAGQVCTPCTEFFRRHQPGILRQDLRCCIPRGYVRH